LEVALEIPDGNFVAIYGCHGSPWREGVMRALEREGILSYDPTDSAWADINEQNGDAEQAKIDKLVAKQHEALGRASCVIHNLFAHVDGKPKECHAARAELAYLAGAEIKTFFYIAPDVVGRNYLWGVMRLYDHMQRCNSIYKATEAAIAWMQKGP
jgi:hypothetical protein